MYVPLPRLVLLKEEAQQFRDMAIFPESAALPESEHLLYQLGWAQATFSYHYLLRTKDRSGGRSVSIFAVYMSGC